MYLYNICDHQEAYGETNSQAISYTTGVPAMIGGMMMLTGKWRGNAGADDQCRQHAHHKDAGELARFLDDLTGQPQAGGLLHQFAGDNIKIGVPDEQGDFIGAEQLFGTETLDAFLNLLVVADARQFCA